MTRIAIANGYDTRITLVLLLLYPGDHPGEIAFRLHWAGRLGTGKW